MKLKCPCPCPSLRTLVLTILVILGTAFVLLIVHQAILPVFGWLVPSQVPTLYDLVVYGVYPTRQYVTLDSKSPSPNIIKWDDSCSDGYMLVAPFGYSVPDAGPMLLDSKGNLIWMTASFGTVMNFRAQTYLNESYLTFWAGHKVGGLGQGQYYMLNSSYDVVRTVSAATPPNDSSNIRHGDLHEFIITDSNTALLTVYDTITYDLSAMGRPQQGSIVDSLFQEVDIATGDLLFEWRASDHFDPATTSQYINPFGGYSDSNSYDFFHINSVQKDRNGNYLISSRHLHAVMTVSGATGEVLWVLGGNLNVFNDISDGKATDFAWQHDARWVDEEEGVLSVFDNGSAGPIMKDASESEGLLIQIDLEKRTAKLLQSYVSRDGILSASQGSVQVMDREGDKHVLVGWGSSAAYSEYTMSGELLCETHISGSALFWWERVKSYRALKTFTWVGRPEYPPTAIAKADRIYVSWNGATEVTAWQLEGRKGGAGDEVWQTVDVKDKVGFEDGFSLLDGSFVAYRVAALDVSGELLRYSDTVEYAGTRKSSMLLWFLGACVGTGIGVGVWLFMTKVPRGQKWKCFGFDRHRYSKVPNIELTGPKRV